jgi:hypothetical protein
MYGRDFELWTPGVARERSPNLREPWSPDGSTESDDKQRRGETGDQEIASAGSTNHD